MKIKDLLNREIDVDILNDYLDADIPAFCGPQGLTKAGIEHYKEVLDLEIELDSRPEPKWAEIKLDNYSEKRPRGSSTRRMISLPAPLVIAA